MKIHYISFRHITFIFGYFWYVPSKTPLSGSYMDLAQKSQDTARVRHTLDSLDISLEPLGIKWFHLGPEKHRFSSPNPQRSAAIAKWLLRISTLSRYFTYLGSTEKNKPAECRLFSETVFFPVFSSPILVYGYLCNQQQCWFMEKMVSPRINHSQFTKNGGHKQSKIGGFLLGLPH